MTTARAGPQMRKLGYLVVGTLVVGGCGIEDGGDAVGDWTQASQSSSRVYVGYHPGQKGLAKAAVASSGGQLHHEFDDLDALVATLPVAALDGLAHNPHVNYIEEDVKRYPFAQTTPYGIPMVQADLVTNPLVANRKICIIDSGYSRIHEDLPDANVDGTNNAGTGNWYDDTCGHGSHVAGTIVATNNNDVGVLGVIGNVNLHIVKVFDGADCGWAYSSTLVSALDACRVAGANVVSMSLGGNSQSSTESNAFQTAYNAGVLSIAAAGNGGNTTTSYPAGYSSVVSVAAVDSTKAVADFSQKNADVEISAPGVAVLSTVPWREENSLTIGATSLSGGYLDGAARSNGTAGLVVNGGLCGATDVAWSGAVVLCERGTFAFAEKVNNVLNSGGVAAVIYNNVVGGFTGTLNGTSTIPAIALSQADGEAARQLVGETGTVVSRHVTGSGYEAWDGTSMAAPHVSAVAALVWSHFPNKTNADVRNALAFGAQDLGATGRDTSYGWGLVQAKAAYDRLAAPPPPADTTAPVISNVSSAKKKSFVFTISWTTNEPSNTVVTFSQPAKSVGTVTHTTLVTSHSMSFQGVRGGTYVYTVSSTDAAGNTSTSGAFTHRN